MNCGSSAGILYKGGRRHVRKFYLLQPDKNGGGSIKKNGIYNEVVEILKANDKNVAEISEVMPNPTLEKLYEGVEIARNHHADLLLAVGGGSVCDYAKAVSVSVNCDEDPWEKYYLKLEEPDCEIVPVGCVLTMVGTGSEMNAGAVITNHEAKLKIGHVFADENDNTSDYISEGLMRSVIRSSRIANKDRRTMKRGVILCGQQHGH